VRRYCDWLQKEGYLGAAKEREDEAIESRHRKANETIISANYPTEYTSTPYSVPNAGRLTQPVHSHKVLKLRLLYKNDENHEQKRPG